MLIWANKKGNVFVAEVPEKKVKFLAADSEASLIEVKFCFDSLLIQCVSE